MKFKSSAVIALIACCAASMNLKSQNVLSGQVTDEQQQPLPFASVSLENTRLATIADHEGKFQFSSVPSGTFNVKVSSVGYKQAMQVIDVSGSSPLTINLQKSSRELDEVVVNSTRAGRSSGMAFSNVSKEQIAKQNLGQDAPFLLSSQTGVVVNSDAGNGVGYTGIRIRGSDATRINVTINGVPVNDAESQGTFWVNMPDLVSSVNNIQIQRGVGTSGNGAGAFGASINFQTNELEEKSHANVITSAGSFDTYRATIAAGTGLINNKFAFDARASRIISQGYIDRASSNLQSYYLSAAYYGKNSVLKLINFRGWEKTYQAWNLVHADSIKNGNRTYNMLGEYTDSRGNLQHYKNETDNYDQNNYQAHFVHRFNSNLHFNLTGHYTKGKGYYEEYKEDQQFADYNMEDPQVVVSDSVKITSTDLIRRKWLDNDFAGAVYNLNYTASSRLEFILGGGYNTYFGRHFDKVIWARYASDTEIDHTYKNNSANKNDLNTFLKTNIKPVAGLNVFVDLQMRKVVYEFEGFNDAQDVARQKAEYDFFNPKVGVSYDLNSHLNVYGSFAIANKEPNRDDFVQSTPTSRPRAEQLADLEAGLKFVKRKLSSSVNVYNMQYKDQLVLNGQVNDVGAYNRVNVKSSYRRGIELEGELAPLRWFTVGANLALSQNKIAQFTEFIDSAYTYDDNGVETDGYTQYQKQYENTDIAFSPNLVASAVLKFIPAKNLELAFIGKSVGRQYLDNTSNSSRSINPYNTLDVRINYEVPSAGIPKLSFMIGIYNVLNAKYETNGYTFSYFYNQTLTTETYLAPAAPVNFLAGLSLKF